MSEVHTKIQDFSKSFYNLTTGDAGHINSYELRKLGKRLSEENKLDFVNSGSWSVVVTQGDNDNFVTAFDSRDFSKERAQEIFHIHRVLSTLFPHNFPRFRSSFPSDNIGKYAGGTERQKIQDTNSNEIKYKFSETDAKLKKIGISIFVDKAEHNFIIGNDGGEYYVDTSMIDRRKWNTKNVIKFMKNNTNQDGEKYTNSEIKSVKNSLVKLKQIDSII